MSRYKGTKWPIIERTYTCSSCKKEWIKKEKVHPTNINSNHITYSECAKCSRKRTRRKKESYDFISKEEYILYCKNAIEKNKIGEIK